MASDSNSLQTEQIASEGLSMESSRLQPPHPSPPDLHATSLGLSTPPASLQMCLAD